MEDPVRLRLHESPKLGHFKVLVGFTILAFLFAAAALFLVAYSWNLRQIPQVPPFRQQLPSPMDYPGGTFPNGSQLVWEDGDWVVQAKPRLLASAKFPTDLAVRILQGQRWDMDFTDVGQLSLPEVSISMRIGPVTQGPVETIVALRSASTTLLEKTVTIPVSSSRGQEIRLSIPSSSMPTDERLIMSVQVVTIPGTLALSIESITITNTKDE
jgi:hypothetical protein